LLCAGITSLSFKYSNLIYIFDKIIVTILKQRSQSAGNFILITEKNEKTSETLCNNSVIKIISVHVSKHLKPINDKEFGHYLAGLIDGDGHFSNQQQLIIVFNEKDASLAYFIKGYLGFGNIYKVKNKKAIILVISKKLGIIKVLILINGKIRSENKLNQIKNNILSNPNFNLLSNFDKNNDNDLNNHWLAGFSDLEGSFQIKLINKNNNKTEVRLNFQIDQKQNELLILIKEFLGGNISYITDKSTDFKENTYSYNSLNFGVARNIINYFDTYHLLSHKHVDYLKWRKSYCNLMEKRDLKLSRIKKILCSIKSVRNYSTSNLKHFNNNLNPFWITGFADGESTFSFSIVKNNKSKIGWTILPSFSLELKKEDKNLLYRLQSFFKVGNISTRKRNNQSIFAVKSVKDLNNIIIPHFNNFPLFTQKNLDFILFKMVVEILFNNKHLKIDDLKKILSIKASMNKGLSDNLINSFPGIIPYKLSLKDNDILYKFEGLSKIDPNWLSGFFNAEGCFDCRITKSSTVKIGYQVILRITLVQHSRDILLFNQILDYWKCGNLRNDVKNSIVSLSITKFSDISNIIIPFFDKYPIQGIKILDLAHFKKIALLIENKSHLTDSGLNLIRDLKSKMNINSKNILP
jgi:LAGLIDADG endonuclease